MKCSNRDQVWSLRIGLHRNGIRWLTVALPVTGFAALELFRENTWLSQGFLTLLRCFASLWGLPFVGLESLVLSSPASEFVAAKM